jgi:hypothetical protein
LQKRVKKGERVGEEGAQLGIKGLNRVLALLSRQQALRVAQVGKSKYVIVKVRRAGT